MRMIKHTTYIVATQLNLLHIKCILTKISKVIETRMCISTGSFRCYALKILTKKVTKIILRIFLESYERVREIVTSFFRKKFVGTFTLKIHRLLVPRESLMFVCNTNSNSITKTGEIR